MANNLSWGNPNNRTDFTTKIYRSTATFTKDTLPGSPVVTLTNGETTWRDPTALFGVEYYYMVACQDAQATYYSSVVKLVERLDDPWGVKKENSLSMGGSYSFGQASTISFGDVPDDVLTYIWGKVGAVPTGDIYRMVIGGRYFLIPEIPLNVAASKFIENNWFLGHRTPALPNGANPNIFGTNAPLVWYGRKWSIGFPKLFRAGETTAPTNLLTAFADAKGRVLMSKLLESEAIAFATQQWQPLKHANIPLNVVQPRATFSSSWGAMLTCDSVVTSPAGAPTISTVTSTQSPTALAVTGTATTTVSYLVPFIEYLGAA